MSDQEHPSDFDHPTTSRATRDDSARLGHGKDVDVGETSVDRALPFDKIDRFVIESWLGRGGFGDVFLAFDPRLGRKVALKLPRVDRPIDESVWKQFIDEGRAVANLKHEAIIQVYDINRQPNGIPYVVMEFVDGQTLNQHCKQAVLPPLKLVELIRQIAEGLKFAHKHNIVHRDLKPANIMIDRSGRARIADFGLALHDNTPIRKISRARAGTTMYMAPEQLRGENHRLDGRTDLWALGVTMYWMFSGRFPFAGASPKELAEEICGRDVKPIRQLNENIPVEVERICSRCLRRLMPERYQSASELIEDLDCFIQQTGLLELSNQGKSGPEISPVETGGDSGRSGNSRKPESASNSQSQVVVVPKGLRSFDAGDAEFFLSLLPGPTDRLGVPDSLRFWQQAYSDPSRGLPIGLLYGPSGCGKTSFVRAGLLPRLPEEFEYVRIECSSDNTETEMVRRVTRLLGLSSNSKTDLFELLFQIRTGSVMGRGRRLLIVLDQFEQWLNAHEMEPTSEMIEALRQCDGDRLQCLVLVRDDFWIAMHQFLKQLDTKIQDGRNALALPLFDERHARKVLTGFGQAYGSLPGGSQKLSKKHRDFVHRAVNSLSDHGKVICAHLSLFAEMMKNRDWTSSELVRIGGWEGIGVRYLEESFGDHQAPARHRRQIPYVQGILSCLIPETGASIKASSCSKSELVRSFEGQWNDDAGNDALEALDEKFRLISRLPGHETADGDDPSGSHSEPRFQLAHDILVEPVSEWLTRQQRETWRGRARIRLNGLSSQWNGRRSNRLLPTFIEYLTICLATKRSVLSEKERTYLAASHWFFGKRLVISLFIVCLTVLLGLYGRGMLNEARSEAIVQAALDAKPDAFPFHVQELYEHPAIAATVLEKWINDENNPTQAYRLQILRSHFDPASTVSELLGYLSYTRGNECANILAALRTIEKRRSHNEVQDQLLSCLRQCKDESTRFKVWMLLFHLSNHEEVTRIVANSADPTERTRFVHSIPQWHGDLVELVSELSENVDDALLMAFCNGLALRGNSGVRRNESQMVGDWLTRLFTENPHAGVHFAAKRALDAWGCSTAEPTPPLHADWIVRNVAGEELCFIHIQGGTAPFGAGSPDFNYDIVVNAQAEVDLPFLIASSEVSARLFFSFVDDESTPVETRQKFIRHPARGVPNLDIPIYSISHFEAEEFCNWLSSKLGDDLAPCRLPTIAEWEIACRAGSTTMFFFGDESVVEFLPDYSLCSVSRLAGPGIDVGPRATRLPNVFGISDMIGNASEWMSDCFHNGPGDPVNYSVRGGHARDSTRSFHSSRFVDTFPDRTTFRTGIRLVIPVAGSGLEIGGLELGGK